MDPPLREEREREMEMENREGTAGKG